MKCNQKTIINDLKHFLTEKECLIQNNTVSLHRNFEKRDFYLIINIIH